MEITKLRTQLDTLKLIRKSSLEESNYCFEHDPKNPVGYFWGRITCNSVDAIKLLEKQIIFGTIHHMVEYE